MNRVKEWTPEQINSYYLGIQHSEYPVIFWKQMLPQIAGCQTLTDIGCGPGAFALRALEAGFAVQAVDLSRKSLDALQEKAGNTDRLTMICGSWPEVKTKQSDVSISAYSFGGKIGTPEGIQKIIALTKKIAFFIAPYDRPQTDFLSKELYQRAGIRPPSFNGSYRELLQIFTDLHLKVQLKTVTFDFGLPLKNKTELKRCAIFLNDKLGLPSPELVQQHLQKIITTKNGFYWVPNPRKSIFIIWRKEERNE